MAQYERDLSNLSYTNKDFESIYPELLDLVKKLSYKWDPSLSDESDPGVVLLKLAALMADKNNYNIDKNILELFPLSVTQESSAREIFEQCGYCMKYYQSANGTISLTMTSEPELSESDIAELGYSSDIDLDEEKYTRTYVIPRFTMFSDIDNNIVYTCTDDVLVTSDKITKNAPVMQGVCNEYAVNDETIITPSHLDYNNRLYFPTLFVPENGIFISSNNSEDYSEWKRVDNLLLQEVGTKCYKFGLTRDGYRCYIEFPEDISSIIGSGMHIRYLTTRGLEGNIGKQRIKQFYTDITAKRYIDPSYTQEVSITSENVYVQNFDSITNGYNPETIDEANRNYQKIKSTFDTLVTLRDYANFLYTNENVSNCFVCDRTNDVQSSYTISENSEEISKTHSFVRDKEVVKTYTAVDTEQPVDVFVTEPELSAFDLRVYGLEFVPNPSSLSDLTRTFNIIDQEDATTSWTKILADTDNVKFAQHNYKEFEKFRPIMIKNKYPIVSHIIPYTKVTENQKLQILLAIKSALVSALNARKLDFGVEIDYDLVYDTIVNADTRIKAVTLDELVYESYVAYADDDGIHELRIDRDSTPPDDENLRLLWQSFRDEIYAKSVLGGTTQLLKDNNDFTYSLNQNNAMLIQGAERITTEAKIKAEPTVYDDTNFPIEFTVPPLQTNENIVFTAPNFVVDQRYSSFVKFIHNIGISGSRPHYDDKTTELVKKEDDYLLKENEYIVFFWKENDESPYQFIKYDSTCAANIISPSFPLCTQPNPDTSLPEIPDELIKSLPANIKRSTDTVTETISKPNSNVVMTFNEYIAALTGSRYVLTNGNSVATKKLNKVHVNNSVNGTRHILWILNNSSDDTCTLFSNENEKEYTLKDGEYFIYSNDARTQLHIMGAGTLITRDVGGQPWTCPLIDIEQLNEYKFEYLSSMWFTIPTGCNVYVTETQHYQVGAGNTITLRFDSTNSDSIKTEYENITSITFTNDGCFDNEGNKISLFPYRISFIDDSGVETTLGRRNDKNSSWFGCSRLDLNCSNTSPQLIDTNHSIIGYDSLGNEIDKVDGSKYSGIYIITDRIINIIGGVKINVLVSGYNTITNEYNFVPLNILAYTKTETDPTSSWSFNGFDAELLISSNICERFTTSELEHFNVVGKFTDKSGDWSFGPPAVIDAADITPAEKEELKNIKVSWENDRILLPLYVGKLGYIGPTFVSDDVVLIPGHTYEFSCTMKLKDSENDQPLEQGCYRVAINGNVIKEVNTDNDDITSAAYKSQFYVTPEAKTYTFRFEYSKSSSAKFECTFRPGLTNYSIPPAPEVVKAPKSLYGYLPVYVDNFMLFDVTSNAYQKGDKQHHSIDFDLPEGSYVVPMHVSTPLDFLDLSYVSGDSNTHVTTITGSSVYNNRETYYLKIDVRASNIADKSQPVHGRLDIDVKFMADDLETCVLRFNKLYNYYVDDSLKEDNMLNRILDLIASMDKQNIFNYTYVIPQDKLITDPLKSTSFLNSLHVYNPYTICQWNHESDKNNLVVVNKVK